MSCPAGRAENGGLEILFFPFGPQHKTRVHLRTYLKATRIHSALFQPEQGWLGYTWHVSQVVCRGDAVVIIIIVWSNRGGSIVGW